MERRYEQQNPWLTFQHKVELNQLWAHMGEAHSKCQHLFGTPLQPGLADRLASVYLRKGALATTAIEGNTLSEEQLDDVLDRGRSLPRSQAYLQQEVENVLRALMVLDGTTLAEPFRLTPEWLQEQNRLILDGLELEEHAAPGRYTETQTVVGPYRSAPPEDVPYLIDRLCEWINDAFLVQAAKPDTADDLRFYLAFLAATFTHLYIAWIHPFGDGNGRTARLAQVAILSRSGAVPWVSANLLSDFYNRTRQHYYARLDAASKRGEVDEFLLYSAAGLVDMLREQIGDVQTVQRRTAWVNYVHETMRGEPSGKTKDRRRELALALPEEPTPRALLPRLNVDLAAAYASSERMLSRDLKRLLDLGLVRKLERGQWAANIRTIDAFKPILPAG